MSAVIIRAIALGLLIVAITLHVVGFVTNVWIHAKLDTRGIGGVMSANDMGSQLAGQVGMTINMGLWKYCMQTTLGPAAGGMAPIDMCQTVNSDDVPSWMKAVQALGILSLLTATLGVGAIIYSFLGGSKGDRARLMPHIMASICLVAGLLALVAVTVYGSEYHQMMENQMTMMGSSSPAFSSLAQNVKDNTSLGYSFALDTVAGLLMVLVAVLLIVPATSLGGPRNLAV